MQYKNTEIKNIDESGIFYGYASVFNIKDSYNDIIKNGAFINSLKFKSINDIKLLWQHNQNQNIGNLQILKEDEIGLYVKGSINLNINKNEKFYSYIKNGFINGLSIGYNVNKFYLDSRGERIIEEIDLCEISIVSFPANKFANITYCKSLNNDTDYIQKLSDTLDKINKILL